MTSMPKALSQEVRANVASLAGRFYANRLEPGTGFPAGVHRVVHERRIHAHTDERGKLDNDHRKGTFATTVQLEAWDEDAPRAEVAMDEMLGALGGYPRLFGTDNPVHVQKVCLEKRILDSHDTLKKSVLLQDVEIWWEIP